MKNKLNLYSLLFLFAIHMSAFGQTDTSMVNIQTAIENEIIEYKLRGAWNSKKEEDRFDADGQYYGKCMTLKLKSKIDSAITVFIDNGIMLVSEDTTIQDMIITKPVHITIPAKKSKTIQLYAMSCEHLNNIPHQDKKYKFGNYADSNLISIIKSIDEKYMNNIAGQSAVWAYTDTISEDGLRNYGATSNSLLLTVDILNKANVLTLLNPPVQKENLKDDTIKNAKKIQPVQAPAINSDNIEIKESYVYTGIGMIILLIGGLILLIGGKSIKKYLNERKKSNNLP